MNGGNYMRGFKMFRQMVREKIKFIGLWRNLGFIQLSLCIIVLPMGRSMTN